MSYNSFPQESGLRTGSTSGDISIYVDKPDHVAPTDVHEFLTTHGWTDYGNDPNSGEALYCLDGNFNGVTYYRWYEAMAYEFYKFITLGGGPLS